MKTTLRLLAAALALSGCTISTIDAPVTVTTKPLPEAARPAVAAEGKEVTGESCSRSILFIIPIGVATVNSAVEDALAQAPGTDTLLRYEERQTYVSALVYHEFCTQVHGYAVSSQRLAQP
ncbi:MAG: hypothetical protein KIT84_36240 [Labilithrix sp.]|nr:hypothetical protein [Labilithrix sp.]MCW5816505.1 hypothetical protein [Labilithrix sp.]